MVRRGGLAGPEADGLFPGGSRCLVGHRHCFTLIGDGGLSGEAVDLVGVALVDGDEAVDAVLPLAVLRVVRVQNIGLRGVDIRTSFHREDAGGLAGGVCFLLGDLDRDAVDESDGGVGAIAVAMVPAAVRHHVAESLALDSEILGLGIFAVDFFAETDDATCAAVVRLHADDAVAAAACDKHDGSGNPETNLSLAGNFHVVVAFRSRRVSDCSIYIIPYIMIIRNKSLQREGFIVWAILTLCVG